MDTSQGTNGDIAVLFSPELYIEEWSCIRLIYQIARSSESTLDPTALNVYLRVEGETFDHLLWTTTERSESWLIASLDLRNSTDKYRVSIALNSRTTVIFVGFLSFKHFLIFIQPFFQ